MTNTRRSGVRRAGTILGAAWLAMVVATMPVATSPSPSKATAATRLNVVLFLTDDQPWYTVPSTIGVKPMPYLESRVLDPNDHWIRFTNAYLNTPICCPTRTTLMTGRYSHITGVETNGGGIANESSTIATWLHGGGYYTGLIGKYLNRYPFGHPYYIPPGWDQWKSQFGVYFNYTNYENGQLVHYGTAPQDYAVDATARAAATFISTAPTDRPFFLYVAPKSAHDPWIPPPRYDGAFENMSPVRLPDFNEADASDKPSWLRTRPPLSPSDVALWDSHREDAFETLLAADDAVRTVITSLEQRGILDQTVFIFMSDNGNGFGEHRWTTKKCEYEECTRTPFLVRFPGATAHTDPRLVSSVDLAPTFADIAGVTPATPVDGRSLLPLFDGTATTWRSGVLIHAIDDLYGTPGYWGIHTQDAVYVELTTGEKELYDLTGVVGPADPYELQNRVNDPAYATLRASLAAQLLTLRGGAVTRAVRVTDTGFTPAVVSGPAGTTVRWTFGGSATHRVLDASGMNLFDSGNRAPGSSYAFTFNAAGTYAYRCALHTGVNGTVSIPVRTGPVTGGTKTIFVASWATLRPAAGYVYDVQIQRPGSSAFVTWKTGTTLTAATFNPDAGKGIYRFRARIRRTAVGRSSGWSPAGSLTVT
jgi:arylsulfatase A-like enzyme